MCSGAAMEMRGEAGAPNLVQVICAVVRIWVGQLPALWGVQVNVVQALLVTDMATAYVYDLAKGKVGGRHSERCRVSM